MTNSIAVAGLVKTFGQVRALDGFDLTVRQGEVHGLLGPNGAGKSTAIRVLLGLLRADAGEVQMLDGDPWHEAVDLHRRLAYVPGDVNLWPNLSGGESIDLIGRLRGGIDKKRRDELLERFKLDPTKKFRTYSKGNRQKVALVAALASDVELFIFDEPTSGLDPLMESVFQSCVLDLKRAGATVLLSSHILAEAEALCDRVSIIREGRIVESGSMKELRHLTRVSVTVQTERELTGLDRFEGVHDVRSGADGLSFTVDSSKVGAVISHAADFGIVSLTSTPPTLEELFMRHYGDEVPAQRETAGARR
ncbi:ATP-binding cassette domain-containing protein [Streptomyces sp. NPDC054871]